MEDRLGQTFWISLPLAPGPEVEIDDGPEEQRCVVDKGDPRSGQK